MSRALSPRLQRLALKRYNRTSISYGAIHIRRALTWTVVLAVIAAAGTYAWKQYRQRGVAADVTKFTPEDVEAVLWIPRVDQVTGDLLTFSRGIQEAARFRELLKPETGVDLGDPDGLRRVGVDPEAGLVVFTRGGMPHVLFGVEDAETFIEALKAKFVNMGQSPAAPSTPDARGVVVWSVPAQNEGTHAAFAAHEGLLVLVYRAGGSDPAAAVRAVLAHAGEGFFESERYREIEAELGAEGPLIWADGASFARLPDGKANIAFLDRVKLPPLLYGMLRSQFEAWLLGVSWAGARMSVNPCASQVQATVQGADGTQLFPPGWLLPADDIGPALGGVLPRDTVLFTRVGINIAGPAELLKQIANLTGGIGKLGDLFGLGGEKRDPVALLLSKTVHPTLTDRHVVRDVLDHLTGHVGIAFAGVHRRARAEEVLNLKDLRRWLGHTIQLVVTLELKEPKRLLTKWWPKRELLGEFGFDVDRLEHDEWTVLRLKRNCGPNVKPRIVKKKKVYPPCETYGAMVAGELLVLTTGEGTLERVYESMAGGAMSLEGLTREPLARGVLKQAPMTTGGYFSFDGLLKAVRNLNLPGGATRYLAQMYELAFTLDIDGGDATSRVLLTR